MPCPRPRAECDHACPKYCGDPCPALCPVEVFDQDRVLPCGHKAKRLPCWQAQDLAKVTCTVLVQRTVPGCNHLVTEQCHIDVSSAKYICKARCRAILECGHDCENICSRCRTRIDESPWFEVEHGKCRRICGRPYATCVHGCTETCHGDEKCSPCQSPCQVRCSHSKC